MTNNSYADELTLEAATELGRPVYVAINKGTSMKTLDKKGQVEEITFDGNGEINGVDRKSTRLNSSHANISYAVFCLKKKKSRTATRLRFELCAAPYLV